MEEDWFEEYSEGLGHEIYRMEITEDDYKYRLDFTKIVEIAFFEENAIVFAIEV